MQQNNMNHDALLQDNDHFRDAQVYPVDLSLFLVMSQKHPASEDNSSWVDPITVTQYALFKWNSFIANGEESSREDFLKAALWLVEQAQCFGDDAMGWPLAYVHPLYFTRGSWLSAIAQGCGLSVLMRAYQLTNDESFLEIAHHVVRTFECDILDGGVCTPVGADGLFFEEVAVYPASHTLHGCAFALLGLYDYVAVTRNSQMQQYIEHSEATLHRVFDEFDCGYWTHADLLRCDLATPGQLAQQVELIGALADCTGCSQCAERASRWNQYRRRLLSRIRYKLAHGEALLKCVLLRLARKIIMPQSLSIHPRSALRLHVCVPVAIHPALGGIGTFLDRMAAIMADRWQLDYLAQRVGPDVGDRVMHQFGKTWMTPWYFPHVWLYTLAGTRKLLSLIHHGVNYDFIISQDGVFSGAFAVFVGKLIGMRVVCFDHSTLTYKSRTRRAEKQRDLNERAWPLLLRQIVRFSHAFYWPSLHILARFATTHADHLLSPGVSGDEIDEVCRDLHLLGSRVTRFNVAVDMQRYVALSLEERVAQRANMDIPSDALVIAITVRFDLEKGLDISMESISRAMFKLPPALRDRVCVMIAGDGKLRGWLEEEIRKRGLSHTCRIMGNISSEGVNSLLAVSDISLHTSTRGVCMPAAVLEGMAAGCAVIASNQPLANVRVLAEERGIVVQAGNVEQTSDALESLLRDSELRDRMGKAAREYIALHHNAELFRRVLLRASYWSDLDQLLER